MFAVGPATGEFPADLARTRDAFVWWYVDLVDPDGNGAVLIWSFGLPFLPAGPGAKLPIDRPSLSLAIYDSGRASFYLLQALDPDRCVWRGGQAWDLERTRIVRTDEDGRVRIDAMLDLDLPGGGTAVGRLRFDGPLRRDPHAVRDPRHSWEPISLGGATAALTLDCGDRHFAVAGRGYHDRNGGSQGLQAQGLSAWRWGRASLADRDLVFYLLETASGDQRSHLFEADPNGNWCQLEVSATRMSVWQRGGLGDSWPARIELDVGIGTVAFTQGPPLDDGPFYLRSPLSVEASGGRGVGFSEHVRVDQLDRPLHRPFVNMRVHDTRGPNSFWLPLFSGPRAGRLRRLVGRGP